MAVRFRRLWVADLVDFAHRQRCDPFRLPDDMCVQHAKGNDCHIGGARLEPCIDPLKHVAFNLPGAELSR